jgi:hypothetical protein
MPSPPSRVGDLAGAYTRSRYGVAGRLRKARAAGVVPPHHPKLRAGRLQGHRHRPAVSGVRPGRRARSRAPPTAPRPRREPRYRSAVRSVRTGHRGTRGLRCLGRVGRVGWCADCATVVGMREVDEYGPRGALSACPCPGRVRRFVARSFEATRSNECFLRFRCPVTGI